MMKKIVKCEDGLELIDIILDETVAKGRICIPQDMIRSVGGINRKLIAKKTYELLVRIAAQYRFVIETIEDSFHDSKYEILEEQFIDQQDGWKTDCYIIGKYSTYLRECGYFDAAVTSVLEESMKNGHYEETLAYLEKMIQHTREYYWIDDEIQPVLIYKGDTICYEVLNFFAEQLGSALEQIGQRVEYFDTSIEEEQSIVKFKGQHFKAIVGVQTYLFSVKMKDGIHYLHEYIYGPKFNFVFDHPIWFYNQLQHHLEDYYILALDENYVNFYQKYYSKKAFLFPPGGYLSDLENKKLERVYNVSFIGTYSPYMEHIRWLHECDREKRFLGNRFITIMRKNVRMPAEEAFERALNDYGIYLEPPEFLELFREYRRLIYGVMNYYREKVIRVLLENGIEIDAFGDSWKQSSFGAYAAFTNHPNVTVAESLEVWKQSKLSLNIMSWHKAGFTERMANIMLSGAVLITDWTRYLEGRYQADELVVFDLDHMEAIVPKIKQLLLHSEERQSIAEKGLKRTLNEHTWDNRAGELVKIVRQVEDEEEKYTSI